MVRDILRLGLYLVRLFRLFLFFSCFTSSMFAWTGSTSFDTAVALSVARALFKGISSRVSSMYLNTADDFHLPRNEMS